MRLTTMRVLLLLYFVASLVVAFPAALGIGRAGELAGTTSGKILAAAIVALGVGALLAAVDPRQHRAVILVLIVFTTLAAIAVLSRLIGDEHRDDPAAVLLPFVAAWPLLLAIFYPRRGDGGDAAE
jgi:hypothetical protein